LMYINYFFITHINIFTQEQINNMVNNNIIQIVNTGVYTSHVCEENHGESELQEKSLYII